MRTQTFQDVATRYAAIIGRNDQVKVTFGGTVVFTDGQWINIPTLPAGTTMTHHEAQVLGGYMDHETAHIRFTQFAALHEEIKKDPLWFYLWNLLEDVRIENLQIKEYPGSKSYLDDLTMEVDRTSSTREKDHLQDQGTRDLQLIYKEAWKKYRNVDTQTIQGELEDQPETREIAELMKRKMPLLKNTEGTINLAKEIKDLLKNPPKIPQELNLQLKPGGKGGPRDQINWILAAQKERERRERSLFLKALLDRIKKKEEKEEKNATPSLKIQHWNGKQILPPVTTLHDKIYVPTSRDALRYQNVRATLSAEITAAKKMLRIYLRTRTKKAWSRGLTEGKLDPSALHKLLLGSKEICMEKRTREMVDTAILLLVDISSSMQGTVVQQTTILMAEAMETIDRLKVRIAGFKTNEHNLANSPAFQKGEGGRAEGVDILLFKDFDETYRKSKDRIGSLRTGKATPLGDAYGHGFEALIKRKEKRRILWVLTDGNPVFSLRNRTHNEFLLMGRMHRKCTRNQIEVFGLAIGRANLELKNYVDPGRYYKVTNMNEVPLAVLNILRGNIK